MGLPGWLALALGVVAMVLLPLPLFALPMGVAAIVIGVSARRRAQAAGQPHGVATAGIVAGVLAIAAPVILLGLLIAGSSSP